MGLATSTEQFEQTITNPVRSKGVLALNTKGLGLRTRMDRPRDVAEPEPLAITPFLSGALSSASVFGEGA
jgi:hypothetical protein